MNIILIILLILLLIILLILFKLWYGFRNIRQYDTEELEKFIPIDYEFTKKKLKTRDGYFITLFNVKHKKNFNKDLNPILFDHMMGASGAIWLILGEELSPGLILAKMG